MTVRKVIALCILCLPACTPPDMGRQSHSARFDTHPEKLFAVFDSACSGATDTLDTSRAGVSECRKLLPPPETAALIVEFDGTLDDLPQLVLRLSSDRLADGGALVTLDAHYIVPRKTGPALRVETRSARITRTTRNLLRAAGGVPQ